MATSERQESGEILYYLHPQTTAGEYHELLKNKTVDLATACKMLVCSSQYIDRRPNTFGTSLIAKARRSLDTFSQNDHGRRVPTVLKQQVQIKGDILTWPIMGFNVLDEFKYTKPIKLRSVEDAYIL